MGLPSWAFSSWAVFIILRAIQAVCWAWVGLARCRPPATQYASPIVSICNRMQRLAPTCGYRIKVRFLYICQRKKLNKINSENCIQVFRKYNQDSFYVLKKLYKSLPHFCVVFHAIVSDKYNFSGIIYLKMILLCVCEGD